VPCAAALQDKNEKIHYTHTDQKLEQFNPLGGFQHRYGTTIIRFQLPSRELLQDFSPL
jgi:hypothetical protein